MTHRAPIGLFLTVALVIGACGDGDASSSAVDHAEDIVHIHELLAGPEGEYFVATHAGLYRVTDAGLDLVGEDQHDLMSAAMTADGTFLASGHPDLGTGELRVEDRPPLLGLVSSTTGETWDPVSLLGEADFHGIVVVDGVIYAADSTAETIVVSADGGKTWNSRGGEVQLVAFAVDPSDPDAMVGIDLDDGLVSSPDGGETWTVDDAADGLDAALTDLEWTPDGQAALDENGTVHHRAGPGERWAAVDGIDPVDALGVDGDRMLAITLPNRIHRSDDGGRTWTTT